MVEKKTPGLRLKGVPVGRELHQTADAFVAHVNKTFNVSLDKLYAAWRDGAGRADWLATQGIEVTRENVNKSIRMIWSDGVSRVLVNFAPDHAYRLVDVLAR